MGVGLALVGFEASLEFASLIPPYRDILYIEFESEEFKFEDDAISLFSLEPITQFNKVAHTTELLQ